MGKISFLPLPELPESSSALAEEQEGPRKKNIIDFLEKRRMIRMRGGPRRTLDNRKDWRIRKKPLNEP